MEGRFSGSMVERYTALRVMTCSNIASPDFETTLFVANDGHCYLVAKISSRILKCYYELLEGDSTAIVTIAYCEFHRDVKSFDCKCVDTRTMNVQSGREPYPLFHRATVNTSSLGDWLPCCLVASIRLPSTIPTSTLHSLFWNRVGLKPIQPIKSSA